MTASIMLGVIATALTLVFAVLLKNLTGVEPHFIPPIVNVVVLAVVGPAALASFGACMVSLQWIRK